jgi:hypothetical protein
VDRFFEELRADHAGQARVVVTAGGGSIQPGTSRDLTCRLEIPITAQAGRSYMGAWQLGNAAHLITVDVTTGKPPSIARRPG